MNHLKERAIRGGLAKSGAQVANVLVRLGSLLILARLLDPVDFGLVGMVTAVTGILGYFREFGLSTASVQRATISGDQMSTLFWINVCVGAALTVVSLAVAPVVVEFYNEPRLFMITVVLASGFLFSAASVQHSALLQRQLRFTALAIIEILSVLASSGVSVFMAMRGHGYWALVAWSLTLPLASTLAMWFYTGWIPNRPRRGTKVRSMMRFGGTVTLNSVVVYAAYNLDKVLLGRFWGAEITGIYGRAYQIINLPTESLNGAVGAVTFSVLARMQDDARRLRRYFLAAYALILGVTVPIAVACALFAHELIIVMLGPKWNDAVPVFRLLAPTILAFALINPTGWLLVSLGMVGRSLNIALVILPLVITGCLVGLPFGPEGVALGMSAAMTVWVIPHLRWACRGTAVSYQDVLSVASRPLVSGFVSAVAAFTVTWFLGGSLSAAGRLLLGCAVLFVVHGWVLLFVMAQKPLYADVLLGWKTRSSEDVPGSPQGTAADVSGSPWTEARSTGPAVRRG